MARKIFEKTPRYRGVIFDTTKDACDIDWIFSRKWAELMRSCDKFPLPIDNLVDTPLERIDLGIFCIPLCGIPELTWQVLIQGYIYLTTLLLLDLEKYVCRKASKNIIDLSQNW